MTSVHTLVGGVTLYENLRPHAYGYRLTVNDGIPFLQTYMN